MQRTLTPTLALILAGGLAAGIGLARPSSPIELPGGQAATAATATAESATGEAATAGNQPDDAYRQGNRVAGARGAGEQAATAPATPAAPAPAPAETAPAPAPAAITIEGFTFAGPATVSPGASIAVTNLDGAAHTLTFRSGEADTGNLDGGATATLTAPTAPGTYAFFCRIHPSMEGQIVVDG